MKNWYETFDEKNAFTIDVDKIIALAKNGKNVDIVTDFQKYTINCETKEYAQNKYDFIKNMIFGDNDDK